MDQMNRVAGISPKYDGALDYGIIMYDNLPYRRDADVCNSSTVALYSGHIIKYYLCINREESLPIDNHDDEIQEILRRIQEKEEEEYSKTPSDSRIPSALASALTDEQLHALTSDQQVPPKNGDVSPKEVINLDDIEDW